MSFGLVWQSYDTKASIYQIQYFLNHNVWFSNRVDMYVKMFGREFDSPDMRNAFKSICMPMFFEQSDATYLRNILNKIESFRNASRYRKKAIQDKLLSYRHKMFEVLGPSFKSEIFLHESCIYMHTLCELVKQGWQVAQVYDGFYAIHQDKTLDLATDIESILDSYVYEYKAKYVHAFNQASKNTACSVASKLAIDCTEENDQSCCNCSSNDDSMLYDETYSYERIIADYFNKEYSKSFNQFDIKKENDYSKPFSKLTVKNTLDQSSTSYRNSIYNSIHEANTRQRHSLDYSYIIAHSFKKQYDKLLERLN